jgi:hypothetical protein
MHYSKIPVGSLLQYESVNGTRYIYIVKENNSIFLRVETLDKKRTQAINTREIGADYSGWTLINGAG